jgi:hypothetical protein
LKGGEAMYLKVWPMPRPVSRINEFIMSDAYGVADLNFPGGVANQETT